MTVVAHITTDGEQADLSQVLAGFNEDDLTVEPENDSPSTDTRLVEVRTNDGENLTQFHEACVEHNIMLNIRRICHESDSADRVTAGANEDLIAR